jgi:hypothetical protein
MTVGAIGPMLEIRQSIQGRPRPIFSEEKTAGFNGCLPADYQNFDVRWPLVIKNLCFFFNFINFSNFKRIFCQLMIKL